MRNHLLALIAGSVMPLAFAPTGLYPVAILSLAVLFYLCLETSPGKSFITGLIYGLGYFGVGISWVQISIHQFGLPVLAFSVSVTIIFVLVIAIFPALTSWCAARYFMVSRRIKLLILLPVLWVIFEWVRSWLFTGFPWLTLGYSQIDSPLSGVGTVAGVYGISLFTAVSAGVVALLWVERQAAFKRAFMILLPVWAGAFVLKGIDWTQPEGEFIKVALIQGNVPQEVKWLPSHKQQTLDLYRELSTPFWGVSDLIIWPETALPGFAHELMEYLGSLKRHSETSGTDILIGLPVADPQTGRYYNALISLGPDRDKGMSIYRKRHLVPFGEYLPLEALLDPVLDFLHIPMSRFSPGDAQQARIETTNYQVGVSICYEDVFGEEVITGLPEADFLVNVSNDAWFGNSLAPHQHLEMARMRSLETGRYLVRSTNTGISAIIDQKGRVTERASQFEVATLTSVIRAYSGATPYVVFGNLPVVILCFITVAWLATRARGET